MERTIVMVTLIDSLRNFRRRETCRAYYQAKERAMNNGRQYHIAAILRRKGRVIRIGINSNKTHPRFLRKYPDGTWGCHMHAEMDVLRFAQPGDDIEVMRFAKSTGEKTMAKPCRHCQKHLITSGIRRVTYTNEQGDWERLEE
jgi:deoxycytidylate deaminase